MLTPYTIAKELKENGCNWLLFCKNHKQISAHLDSNQNRYWLARIPSFAGAIKKPRVHSEYHKCAIREIQFDIDEFCYFPLRDEEYIETGGELEVPVIIKLDKIELISPRGIYKNTIIIDEVHYEPVIFFYVPKDEFVDQKTELWEFEKLKSKVRRVYMNRSTLKSLGFREVLLDRYAIVLKRLCKDPSNPDYKEELGNFQALISFFGLTFGKVFQNEQRLKLRYWRKVHLHLHQEFLP